ncbi:MAG: hypothetical protein Q9161_005236 [Pseudevernia consocians]
MTHVHNVIIRGVNSIYLQAPNVRNPSDIKDFLHFVTLWGNFVDRHHETEEESIFPDLEIFTEQKDLMQHSVEQHHAFHSGLQQLKDYASSTAPEDYSSDKLKSIIDDFGPTLQEHLIEEIDALLALRKYDNALNWRLEGIAHRIQGHKNKTANYALQEEVFPFALSLADTTYEGGIHKNFPPVPFFIPYIVHYWFSYNAESYVKDRFSHRPDIEETFVDLQDPILRADFIRYLVLLGDGGMYSDIDTTSLIPIDDWVPSAYVNKQNLTGMTESKLVGDVLILPINAFGSGQMHSKSGSPNENTALVQHLFKGSWKADHPFRAEAVKPQEQSDAQPGKAESSEKSGKKHENKQEGKFEAGNEGRHEEKHE